MNPLVAAAVAGYAAAVGGGSIYLRKKFLRASEKFFAQLMRPVGRSRIGRRVRGKYGYKAYSVERAIEELSKRGFLWEAEESGKEVVGLTLKGVFCLPIKSRINPEAPFPEDAGAGIRAFFGDHRKTFECSDPGERDELSTCAKRVLKILAKDAKQLGSEHAPRVRVQLTTAK